MFQGLSEEERGRDPHEITDFFFPPLKMKKGGRGKEKKSL